MLHTRTCYTSLLATPLHQVCELLGWTGLESTAAAAQVCSQWRRLLAHGAVWQLLCRRARGVDGQLLYGTPRLRVPTLASEPATADERQGAGRAQRTATHAETQPVAAASEAADEAASEAAGAAGAASGASGLTLTITAGAVGAAGLTLTITAGAAAGEAAGAAAGEAAGAAAEDGWRRRGLLLQTEEAALRRRWHSSTCEESSHQPHSEHIMALQLHRGLLVTCSADRTIALAELPRDSVALTDADHPTGRGGSSGGGGRSRGGDTIGPTAVLHGHDDQVTRPHARISPTLPSTLSPWASRPLKVRPPLPDRRPAPRTGAGDACVRRDPRQLLGRRHSAGLVARRRAAAPSLAVARVLCAGAPRRKLHALGAIRCGGGKVRARRRSPNAPTSKARLHSDSGEL